jgi:hypothetical protein
MSLLEIPVSQIPNQEVLVARATDSYSDLFPFQHVTDSEGLLGNYTSSDILTMRSPLWSAVEGVREYYRSYANSSTTEAGLASESTHEPSTFLQIYLARCIDKGYANLLTAGQSPHQATEAIAQHIDARDQDASAGYNKELTRLTIARAEQEREMGVRIDGGALTETRLRLQRLKFEWLSATTILNLLDQSV